MPPRAAEVAPQGFTAKLSRELREVASLLTTRNVWLCSLVSICAVGSIVVGSIFMPLYMDGPLGIDPVVWSKIMAAVGLAPAVGAVSAGMLSERVGRRPALVLFCLLMAIAPAALLWVGGSASVTAALLFVSWMGLGSFPLFMGVIPAETLGRARAAAAMGAVVAVGEIFGGFALPPLVGGLADGSSLDVALQVQLGLGLAAGIIALFVAETNPRFAKSAA